MWSIRKQKPNDDFKGTISKLIPKIHRRAKNFRGIVLTEKSLNEIQQSKGEAKPMREEKEPEKDDEDED